MRNEVLAEIVSLLSTFLSFPPLLNNNFDCSQAKKKTSAWDMDKGCRKYLHQFSALKNRCIRAYVSTLYAVQNTICFCLPPPKSCVVYIPQCKHLGAHYFPSISSLMMVSLPPSPRAHLILLISPTITAQRRRRRKNKKKRVSLLRQTRAT